MYLKMLGKVEIPVQAYAVFVLIGLTLIQSHDIVFGGRVTDDMENACQQNYVGLFLNVNEIQLY